eukprot:Hpha_TRINITY_DN16385_c2_g3::TRINITY_DN16385_c2_g3_i1::g.58205::m.58205
MAGYAVQCLVYASLAAVVSAGILLHYAKESWRSVGALTLVAVYVCFLATIVPVAFVIVDVDAATRDAGGSPPWLDGLWKCIFWMTQALSWAVMPILQCYGPSGEFSTRARLWGAVKENLLLYFAMGVVIALLGVYILVSRGLSTGQLLSIAIAASNAFGLFCICLFLGYGLAKVPYSLWNDAVRMNKVVRLSWSVATLHDALDSATLEHSNLSTVLEDLDMKLRSSPDLHSKLGIIRQVANEADLGDGEVGGGTSRARPRRRGDSAVLDDDDLQDIDFATHSGLVKLHRKTKAASQNVRTLRYRWQHICNKILFLEDAENVCGLEGQGPRRIDSVGDEHRHYLRCTMQDTGVLFRLQDQLEWVFQRYLRFWMFRAAAVVSALASVVLVWCESIALPLGFPALSPLHLLISESSVKLHHLSLLTFLPYAAAVCYWSLFKIKFFESHLLVPHMSSGENLCFTSYMLTRLILPLCYNFLLLAWLADEKEPGQSEPVVAFSRVYGKMDGVALLGDSFNRFLPCMLLIVAVIVVTGGTARCSAAIGIETFQASESSSGRAEEGRDLLRIERRSREDALQRRLARQADSGRRVEHTRLQAAPDEVEV